MKRRGFFGTLATILLYPVLPKVSIATPRGSIADDFEIEFGSHVISHVKGCRTVHTVNEFNIFLLRLPWPD